MIPLSLVGAIIGLILCIRAFRKNRREGADLAYCFKFIKGAIVTGSLVLFVAGSFAISFIFNVIPRWMLDQKINVDKTVITHKYTREITMSDGTTADNQSYILADDAGEEYSVLEEVYNRAEINGEYYCARLGAMKNCINIYDTDEYEYNK